MVSVLFILGCFFIGNTKCKGADLEYISQETANYAVQERGYDLPVDEVVKEEAIEDCKNVMNQMKAIYQKADKGTSSNVVVSETVMEEMQEVLKEKNVTVITSAPYSNMANYSKIEEKTLWKFGRQDMIPDAELKVLFQIQDLGQSRANRKDAIVPFKSEEIDKFFA